MYRAEVIGGRFHLERELGRGGTAVVWAAVDATNQTRVAVKLLAPELCQDPVVLDRFAREGELLHKCTSSHVVRMIARGQDEKHGPYLTMELLEGETLQARLARLGSIAPKAFRPLARSLTKALEQMHAEGMIHRDIKPANVFLHRNGQGGESIKLLDFGTIKITHGADADGRTMDGALVGTPSRMSPEQACGGRIDARTDVWAFAMLAFEALVGFPAVDGAMPQGQIVLTICRGSLPVPSQFNAALGERFDLWFRRSTAVDPNQRFASVGEQFEALDRVLSEADEPKRRTTKVTIEVTGTLSSLPPLVPRIETENRADGSVVEGRSR